MSDGAKKEPSLGAREIIGVVGLVLVGAGFGFAVSWPVAGIVDGAVLLAVAFGYIR